MVSKRRRQGKRGNILLAMLQARFSTAFEFHPANSKMFSAGRVPVGAPTVWLTSRK
jgi:hypothetical protein